MDVALNKCYSITEDLDGLQTFISLWKELILSYVDREAGMRLGFEIHVENQMRIVDTTR